MLVYVAPVLDIGLCCHSLFKKSNSYKEEKKGDIITNMKSISVRIDISYSCYASYFLYSIIKTLPFQLTMKSILKEILTQSLQILLNARTVAPLAPLYFKSLQVILVLFFHHPLFQMMSKLQYRIVCKTIKSPALS